MLRRVLLHRGCTVVRANKSVGTQVNDYQGQDHETLLYFETNLFFDRIEEMGRCAEGAHTYTHRRAHMHTHTHACARAHTRACSHAHARTHKQLL